MDAQSFMAAILVIKSSCSILQPSKPESILGAAERSSHWVCECLKTLAWVTIHDGYLISSRWAAKGIYPDGWLGNVTR